MGAGQQIFTCSAAPLRSSFLPRSLPLGGTRIREERSGEAAEVQTRGQNSSSVRFPRHFPLEDTVRQRERERERREKIQERRWADGKDPDNPQSSRYSLTIKTSQNLPPLAIITGLVFQRRWEKENEDLGVGEDLFLQIRLLPGPDEHPAGVFRSVV
ncbi:hypothetical protein L3Q82_006788 [Scortum barcoo]|uniref:Uncharacterized protein n=1 Tax=Scortum barcoo TaxID=214431 RepID=A0ACB8WV72_9TELE|nr:hypothetical protein L3Q82_006788 [Scortum barcoo]